MSFIETTTAETSSFAFDSFLDFNVKNLRTFSGDVYRLRVSGGSKTQISDFPVLLDTVLESPQLLIDSNSPSGVLRTGYIQSQAHITKYWENSSNLTPSFNSTELIDAVKLSGSLSQKNDTGRFSLKSAYNFEVNKDVVYTVSMRIVGKKGIKVQSDDTTKKSAKIKFHISGSNISPDSNPKYSEFNLFGGTIKDEFGNVVGLELNEESPEKVDYGKVSHTFKIPFKKSRVTNSDTIFQFRVESGEWFISDISLRPALDTGFSPDNVSVRVPIPTNSQRPDKFQFILQYYDVNNNEAEEVTLVDDVDVEGQSLLIQGDDNLVKGTVTIGNVQGEGVEIKGGNSAFIRAVGYTGFTDARAGTGGGFFLWSGSVAPGGETQDNYNGAGLEIHDGNTGANESFFKFRTDDADNANNSTFDLKTSRFFLGGGGQFISGSLGNIEISSSNFHLQNDGDVVMQGTITAEAGGTIGGFNINANELQSDSGLLILRGNNGKITGSQVLFTGGKIGGFTLGSDTITGGKLVLDADGTIRSSDFRPNEAGSGFRLTAANGGTLEVESATIRGTLKTTTFEKESVNAVGGQLYVANSTVLTSSAINPNNIHTETQRTMSVENASGFVNGEIALIKKVSPTGFSTEYILIDSASRNDPSSDVDTSGNLFVTRGFGNGTSGISGSLGDTPGAAQSYSGSQVIVSTGRLNTGFMRLNANPNDISTPFMDIVERTGSGIYDVELKTRLGDLSGVAGTRNIPSGFEGFGLMTETAFLSGSNIKLEAPRFLLGDLNSTFVSGSNRNIEISSSRFHLQPDGDTIMQGKITATSGTIGGFNIGTNLESTSGTLNLKGASGQLTASAAIISGSNVLLGTDVFRLDTTNLLIESSTPQIRVGPASGGSKITLDGSSSELTFNSGSGATEVLKFQEQGQFTLFDNTTLSNVTAQGANISFKNGGFIVASGSHPLGEVQQFGFDDNQAFFQGGRSGAILHVQNIFNSAFVRGAFFRASAQSGATSAIAINANADTSVANINASGLVVSAENSNSSNSSGDVTGANITARVDNSNSNNDVRAAKFRIARSDGLGATYTSKGRAIDVEGGHTAVYAAGAGTYQGYFDGLLFSTGTISGSLINSSGDVVAFQSSDKRLKDNLKPISQSIDKLNKLTGYEFDWNDKQDIYKGHDLGVIAQEVEEVLPELVRRNSNGFKAVKYEKIIPLLIEALKDQQEQIDELKKKLEEL